MKSDVRKSAMMVAALIVALICGTSILLTSCVPTPHPKWGTGAFVRSVLSNERGQIIALQCRNDTGICYYNVRFVGLSMTTKTHIFVDDDAISIEPLYVVKFMHEYELKDD